MSKYNLIDIYEEYQIGSGWTNDFDYDGMLKTGLGTSIDTPIEVLKQIFEDFTDVNYHREAEHLSYAIDAIEIGDMMEAQGKISDFHAEIKKTQGDQGMDIEPTVGKFMASKMEENTEAVDLAIEASQEKAGIKEGRYASIDGEVANRIEGFLNIPMKKKFLDAWEDLFYDLVDDEPFDMEDVLAHLNNEMGKVIDGNQMAGDRLALGSDDFEQEEFTAIDEEETVTEDKMIDTAAKMIKDRILKDVPMDIIMDFVKTHLQDIRKMSNSEIKDEFEEFRSVNYDYDDPLVSIDENLKKHFGRFMKDYQ